MDTPAFARATLETTLLTEVSLVGVERRGVANLPDLTGRVFLALAEIDTHVLLISGASAAGDFCFLIPQHSLLPALDTLRNRLQPELERRDILRLWARNDVLAIKVKAPSGFDESNPGLDLCALLAAEGVNILLVQGHSPAQATLVIASGDEAKARDALNR